MESIDQSQNARKRTKKKKQDNDYISFSNSSDNLNSSFEGDKNDEDSIVL
jgi:hypothetical protein